MNKSKYWLHYFIVLQVISMAATLCQNLAFGEILGSFGASAQIFGFAGAFAVFALALGLPYGGKLVDKFGGTQTFLWAQKISIAANLLSLVLYFYGAGLYWWIAYQIFYGLISSIEVASRQHFIFENLPHKNSHIKRGLSTVSFDISLIGFAKIIGYTMGAKLLENTGFIWAFMFNAFTYFIMALWIARNHKVKVIPTTISKYSKRLPLKTIWSNLHLRKLLLCESVFAFSLFAINTQAYLLVKTLNSPYHFGWLFAAAATGNFLVNIIYTRKYGFRFRFNIILFSGMALVGLLLLAWHLNFWICLIGVFLTGASLTNFSITTRAHLHETLVHRNKGAIFSVFQVNWNMWTGIGTLFFGTMVDYTGFTISFLMIFAVISLFTGIFILHHVKVNETTEVVALSKTINNTIVSEVSN